MKYIFVLIVLLFSGCTGKPDAVNPVSGFDLDRYLGKWYEIARLDHSFERGMEAVSATYTLREDGGVKVLNRGFITNENKWNEAVGKAYFVHAPETGFLKVSFFGPFYGSYIVMDTDYETYSLISGPDHSYLWILARKPVLGEEVLARLLAEAKAAGFDTDKLIWTDQTRNETP
ncbi:MAG TPA: lipocalin [Sulfuricurvum sp.]|nr:lipocalin [Sulfuricurvum sp.]